MTPADVSFRRRVVIVLLPFAAGFYLSNLLRNINAIIADQLAHELGLGPAQLGLLTSAYFLAMAAAQLPIGVLLDRHGPRRVHGACLIVAATGAALFAVSHGIIGLAVGRALIGLGIGTALMSGIKATVLWFPRDRLATMNGWLFMLGALGAVTATVPTQMLVDSIGWRGVFGLLAVLAVILAVIVVLVVPERVGSANVRSRSSSALRTIVLDPRFLRIAPLSALCIGAAWSMNSLWAAAWLSRVDGLSSAAVVQHLLVMSVALGIGGLGFGWSADRLRRHGLPIEVLFGGVALASTTCQVALVAGVDLPSYVIWAIIGAAGSGTVLSYAILAGYFPREISGQANGALNLLHFGAAFGLQIATGFIVDLWSQHSTSAEAHRVAFGVTAGLQAAAFVWFAVCVPITKPITYSSDSAAWRTLAVGAFGRYPAPFYERAQLVYARHVSLAKSQARMWRLAAVGSTVLCAVLATETVVVIASNAAVSHVIQADASDQRRETLALGDR